MLTADKYFMGRDKVCPDELTDTIRANAAETVRRANLLLEQFYSPGAEPRGVRSGWEPHAVRGLHHLTGMAVDIEDVDRRLAHWCAANEPALEAADIWMERPEATRSWVHWQTVPPGSMTRYFWPSVSAYRQFVASGAQPIIV